MKDLIKSSRTLHPIAKAVYFGLVSPFRSFAGSENYWKHRYQKGGSSGAGSYQKFSKFKAETINRIVEKNNIQTVIEYGCGDGNQLILAKYPLYTGFDVSPKALSLCADLFAGDNTKHFKSMHAYENERAELTLSLDVIYHLIEDKVFGSYMERLFDSSTNLVAIYSSNTETQEGFQAPHVRHRDFSAWVEKNRPDWKLTQQIPNIYPYKGDDRHGSFSDFYIYTKQISS